MGNYFIIRWRYSAASSEPRLHWLVVTPAGQVLDTGEGDFVAAQACYQRFDSPPSVVLLAPGHEILLCQVEIPSEQQRHLKQVLPFLVEEKLVDDIEDVHAAIGPRVKAQPLAVAVVKHVALINWLDQLYSAGFAPSWAVSEAMALPWQEGEVSVWVGRELSLIRHGQWLGMACDPANLAVALAGVCQRASVSENMARPEVITLWYAADAPSAERAELLRLQLAESVGAGEGGLPPMRMSALEGDLTTFLGQQWVAQLPASLNLLQGGYAANVQSGQAGVDWRKIGLGLAACVLLHVSVTLGAGAWFNYRAQAVKADAIAVYRDWFPEARRVFEPRRQLVSQLNGLSEYGSDRLLSYVNSLSTAWAASGSDLSLVSLDFEAPSDTLKLELRAVNIEALELFRTRLNSAGMNSDLQQVTRHKEGINGRLELGGVM